jgi:hypothetical protein
MKSQPCHCCIVPPYVLESIVRNGSPRQRAAAQRTLLATERFRFARLAPRAPGTPAGAAVAAPRKHRLVYDAGNATDLPGVLVRSEGDGATGDPSVDEAYEGLGSTFDLYWDSYQRNSIDNAGQDLIATVHYGEQYNNAFWDGSQMIFGDGDGEIFNRFTIAIDVVGHELTHGVIGETARLEYHDQPGALNESIADVFGALVKQRALGQTAADADWLIGAGLLAAGINGVALRSMKAPGTAYDDPRLGRDPQPAHMDNYDTTPLDHGGVHINSGIPNRAFYLAAVALGGHAWDVAGDIWYRTLLDPRLSSTAEFLEFARLTVDNARQIHGAAVANTIRQAWMEVGIAVERNWEEIGHANDVVGMAATAGKLFCATADNRLWSRDPVDGNVDWEHIGHANDVVAMAASEDKLYCATRDNRLWRRDPVGGDVNWEDIGHANDVVGMAALNGKLFCATSDNRLWQRDRNGHDVAWEEIGHANDVVAMTAINERLFCATSDHRLWTREPAPEVNWEDIGHANDVVGLAAINGLLFCATADDRLWRRDPLP